MRLKLASGLVAGLLIAPVGCGPEPVVEQPPQQDQIEVDVERDRAVETDPNTGVDVQIGGGEGVQVDVDPNQPGTDVNVGGANN